MTTNPLTCSLSVFRHGFSLLMLVGSWTEPSPRTLSAQPTSRGEHTAEDGQSRVLSSSLLLPAHACRINVDDTWLGRKRAKNYDFVPKNA
jgi:hypothetical protein